MSMAFLLPAVLLVLGVCAAAEETAPATLREAAQKHNLLIGAAVNYRALTSEATYRDVLKREFNILTPENEFKWGALDCKQRGEYNFTRADALAKFAKENGLAIHGHTFVWHNQIPEWLEKGQFSREEMLAILKEHIQTMATRYADTVTLWDVVNEAFDDKTKKLRDTVWRKCIGDDYIEQAFLLARAAAPKAKLLYNDYSAENIGQKADAIYEYLKDLKARHVPVDGIGFQTHIALGGINREGFAKNLHRFAELGLEIYITELDIRLKEPAGADDLQRQADLYAAILDCCLKEPACKGFQTWGFTDKHSWVPGFFKGFGSALLFDKDYQPKPAYTALLKRLQAP